MFKRWRSSTGSRTGYIDLTMNMLLAFASLVVILLMILKTHDTPTETNMISPGDIMIKVTWADGSSSDVDLWVRSEDPEHYTGFKTRKNSVMFLDRDDLGNDGDYSVRKNGERVGNLANSEIIYITFKGKNRYTVNLHMYNPKGTNFPEDCIVELITTDPTYKVVYSKVVPLNTKGEERTAFIFTTNENGAIDDITTDTEEKFVYEQLGGK